MNTKMIVTGDMTQIDLPASQTSGLVQAIKILKGVKGISFIETEQERHRTSINMVTRNRGGLRKIRGKRESRKKNYAYG